VAAATAAVLAARKARQVIRRKIFPLGDSGMERIKFFVRLRQMRLISAEQQYQGYKYTFQQMQSFNAPELYKPAEERHTDYTEEITQIMKTKKPQDWPMPDPSNPDFPDYQYAPPQPDTDPDPPFVGADEYLHLGPDKPTPGAAQSRAAAAAAAAATAAGGKAQETKSESPGFAAAMTMDEAINVLGLTKAYEC